MDIIAGLAAATQAIGIVKQLRDVDRAIDESVFKARLVELQENVFEVKTALLKANEEIQFKDAIIKVLEAQIEALQSGDKCPACSKGRLQKTNSRTPRMTVRAQGGVQEWTMSCDNQDCGHQEMKLHDPNGILKP